jgi:hypothetical protein
LKLEFGQSRCPAQQREGQLIQTRIENKYRFNMQVSSKPMAGGMRPHDPEKELLGGRFFGKLEALVRFDARSQIRYEGELDGAKHAWRKIGNQGDHRFSVRRSCDPRVFYLVHAD